MSFFKHSFGSLAWHFSAFLHIDNQGGPLLNNHEAVKLNIYMKMPGTHECTFQYH